MGITFIEVMPLGDVEAGRFDQYVPSTQLRAGLAQRFTLEDVAYRTGGALRTGAEDGRPRRLHHTAQPQFLQELQSAADHVYRNFVHVPGPRGRGRSAEAVTGLCIRRSSLRRIAKSDRP
jgi:hypothetical protein